MQHHAAHTRTGRLPCSTNRLLPCASALMRMGRRCGRAPRQVRGLLFGTAEWPGIWLGAHTFICAPQPAASLRDTACTGGDDDGPASRVPGGSGVSRRGVGCGGRVRIATLGSQCSPDCAGRCSGSAGCCCCCCCCARGVCTAQQYRHAVGHRLCHRDVPHHVDERLDEVVRWRLERERAVRPTAARRPRGPEQVAPIGGRAPRGACCTRLRGRAAERPLLALLPAHRVAWHRLCHIGQPELQQHVEQHRAARGPRPRGTASKPRDARQEVLQVEPQQLVVGVAVQRRPARLAKTRHKRAAELAQLAEAPMRLLRAERAAGRHACRRRARVRQRAWRSIV
eukprot:366318-Chlamydomonas_euryale.AAC.19